MNSERQNRENIIAPTGVAKLIGKAGYQLREGLNEFRCGVIQICDAVNNLCFTVIQDAVIATIAIPNDGGDW